MGVPPSRHERTNKQQSMEGPSNATLGDDTPDCKQHINTAAGVSHKSLSLAGAGVRGVSQVISKARSP